MLRVDPSIRRRGFLARLLDLLSSVWLGITLLTLILIYAAIFSAVAPLRGVLELTEMQAFAHWLFAALVCLFCVVLTLATIRRVRWNVTNLGVLTVHTGLLLLTLGSVWYFARKIEGSVLLISPRLELVATSGANTRLPSFLAETGNSWGAAVPVLGGDVRFTVLDTKDGGMDVVEQATVRIEIAGQPPREVTLHAKNAPSVNINERLALRLTTFPAESKFYDRELAALYVHRSGAPENELVSRAMHGLPLHRERYLPEDDGVLIDAAGRPAPSKRFTPEVSIAMPRPLAPWLGNWRTRPLWTGWFERWRMPVAVDSTGLPFEVQVTGYVPYMDGMREVAVAGGDAANPALTLRIETSDGPITRSVFANDPRLSQIPAQFPVEFRWVQSDEERELELASRAGTHELYIETREPPTKQTLAVIEGQTVEIPGTTYSLRVVELIPSWPLMSPGYEGVTSAVARIDVTNGDKQFNRTVVQRFWREAPHLTQDIDENGKRFRESLDPNLIVRYRGSPMGAMTLVAGPTTAAPVEAAYFDTSGRAERRTLSPEQGVQFANLGDVRFVLTALLEKARLRVVPVVTPLEARRPNLDRNPSAIRVKFTGRGALEGWSDSRWVGFSGFPHRDANIVRVTTPDGANWDIVYSRAQHDLGGDLAVRKLETDYFPGRMEQESWHSFIRARARDSEQIVDADVYTNQTWTFGQWTLFQSGAPQEDDWSWTVLGVGNREGMWAMVTGSILVPIGCLYAFYVKPLLRRRATQRALAGAARTTGQTNGAPAAAARETVKA